MKNSVGLGFSLAEVFRAKLSNSALPPGETIDPREKNIAG